MAMAHGILGRPALGQIAELGSLYDARTDTFISRSIFNGAPPAGTIDDIPHHSTDISTVNVRSFKEQCAQFEVGDELGASILAGLVQVNGCARYLSVRKAAHTLLRCSITTVEEQLNLAASEIRESLAFPVLDTDIATHLVAGVRWGANYLVCRDNIKDAKTPNEINTQSDMDAVLQRLGRLLSSSDLNGEAGGDGMADALQHPQGRLPSDLSVFGDVLPKGVPIQADGSFSTDHSFLQHARQLISGTSDGKGKPIFYYLVPLPFLAFFRLVDVKVDLTVHVSNPACLEMLVQHFDEAHVTWDMVHRYLSRCQRYTNVVPLDHVRDIELQLQASTRAHEALKLELAATLRYVRSGRANPDSVGQLLQHFEANAMSPSRLRAVASLTAKIDFAEKLMQEGCVYVGSRSQDLNRLISQSPHDDAYILYFNDAMRRESDVWDDALKLFLELLHDTTKPKLMVAVDCDGFGQALEKPYISQLRHRRILIEDLVEHRKVLAANCVMQYDETALDASLTSKPLQRRAVRISCPHPDCDQTLRCSWICAVCQSPVEYGYVDDGLYCDCGTTPFDRWKFKCNDFTHGQSWASYDRAALLLRLKDLEPFEELNILILGETGVGKSTWINAFVNYLTYKTLGDAIDAGDLKCLIPCSFSTQLKDPSDPHGRFIQKDIKIGKSQQEHDGARGQSATQCTSVYAVDIGKTRVRLIDTPGIGDTKGLQQDNRNLADILRVLRTYDKLHGILILLKPNAARLAVMFRFCIKQLLTQLHRNAANNIVFGFTNTRGSNYKPGDTFKPLESLLTEYKKVEIGLFEHNAYCFDSESFRYLAARQKGIDMGLLEDNARSWEYSVAEAKRLLKHIRGIPPHQVRSTINLNETRDMIIKLTEPMALIAQKIQTSIAINNDQIAELRTTELSRAELEKSLFVQRETVESYEVDQPRTVCTHGDCVEVRNDFAGRDETVIVYKTMCHKPCYLSGVKRNQKGDPELRGCWAMDGNEFCRMCGHNYMDHMHIYYDYKSITYKHENQDVSRELIERATDIELQQQAIELRKTAIEEFKLEHAQVQEAAIQFGFFLQRHAIEPYNDATVEYVDHLIDQEKLKIKNGGKKDTLEMLKRYKAEHLQKVQALTQAMARGETDIVLDDQGVRQLVDSLYGLPHFGDDLKRIVRVNEKAAEATFREKSCNVTAGAHWTGKKRTRGKRGNVRAQADKRSSSAGQERPTSQRHTETSQAEMTAPSVQQEEHSGRHPIRVGDVNQGTWVLRQLPWFPAARQRLQRVHGWLWGN
jgi:predicted GTPase/D-ribose pyranose/furanose isomerase RbsD